MLTQNVTYLKRKIQFIVTLVTIHKLLHVAEKKSMNAHVTKIISNLFIIKNEKKLCMALRFSHWTLCEDGVLYRAGDLL